MHDQKLNNKNMINTFPILETIVESDGVYQQYNKNQSLISKNENWFR